MERRPVTGCGIIVVDNRLFKLQNSFMVILFKIGLLYWKAVFLSFWSEHTNDLKRLIWIGERLIEIENKIKILLNK